MKTYLSASHMPQIILPVLEPEIIKRMHHFMSHRVLCLSFVREVIRAEQDPKVFVKRRLLQPRSAQGVASSAHDIIFVEVAAEFGAVVSHESDDRGVLEEPVAPGLAARADLGFVG